MLELLGLALFYAMLIASITFYALLVWNMIVGPVHRPPAAPIITLVLAVILVLVANVDPPSLPGGSVLSRVGAIFVLAWLGLALWRRT